MESKKLQNLFSHLEDIIIWRINNTSEPFYNLRNEFNLDNYKGFQLVDYMIDNDFSNEEVVILLVALLPKLDPLLLKRIYLDYPHSSFFDFCALNDNGRLFYPTVQALQYIFGGDDIAERLNYLWYFSNKSIFIREDLIFISNSTQPYSSTNNTIGVNQLAFNKIIWGQEELPTMSNEFPAERIETHRKWSDLILPSSTLKELQSIESWFQSNSVLMEDWGMGDKLKPGFRILFYGDPGTGKTLAASLLGKYTGKPVFRVDLSMLVSKYIGETEKQLAKLFDRAENKNWILFFDEADAIFGKRTNVKDSHDKYANQEVSYLLQRIETFSGLLILASNFKNNMDKAFTRRFQSCIKFNNPKYEERLRIWEQNLPEELQLQDIKLEQIAKRYELTGSNIMNVIQDVSLKTIASDPSGLRVTLEMLLDSIKKEYIKEDKVFN